MLVSDYGPDVGRHMMTCQWRSRWRPSCPVPLTRYIHIIDIVHTLYRALLLYLGGSWLLGMVVGRSAEERRRAICLHRLPRVLLDRVHASENPLCAHMRALRVLGEG